MLYQLTDVQNDDLSQLQNVSYILVFSGKKLWIPFRNIYIKMVKMKAFPVGESLASNFISPQS